LRIDPEFDYRVFSWSAVSLPERCLSSFSSDASVLINHL
jgi:hypothetical protein